MKRFDLVFDPEEQIPAIIFDPFQAWRTMGAE
jgi:hypothetical protein